MSCDITMVDCGIRVLSITESFFFKSFDFCFKSYQYQSNFIFIFFFTLFFFLHYNANYNQVINLLESEGKIVQLSL